MLIMRTANKNLRIITLRVTTRKVANFKRITNIFYLNRNSTLNE